MKIYSGFTVVIAFVAAIFLVGCAGGPLTTREKGAGIGAFGGAAVGAIIGNQIGKGHPGAGAAIGGALGLGAGALVGDQLQGRENTQKDLERQIELQQKELEQMQRCLRALQSDVRPLPPGC
ncbi:MAG: OmpA/MotB family outer membrane protein [Parcubacteria group bacterium GW2011_GWA2_45_30]|nr:MAG: OmpA/MotB family outer membrane protein [Parcubacteria group bacterium GW2011_GWA2_45_30]